jgi:hypothetical protein
MTHALRALRRMRRDETNAEFAAFPVPKTWAGFAPVATPHMSAAFRNEPPKETKETNADRARERERENVPSGNPEPARERATTPSAAETADRRHGAAPSLATGAHLQIALLVAAVAAASFSAGRVWSSRKA